MSIFPLYVVALAMAATTAVASTSAFEAAPPEARAVTVKAKADGKADDSEAIQQAIDQSSEHSPGGVVFLPSGRYRITRSILIWPGVRGYGVGKTRPVLVLGNNTAGFDKGLASMVAVVGARRGLNVLAQVEHTQIPRVPFPPPTIVPFDPKIWDANPGTFYSAMSNVDFEIGAGNPAATGIRFRTAQHAFLSNMDFELGSGCAGIYQAGNVVLNLHFHGGRYGIVTEKPSPAWQFTVIDSTFDGQRSAAIREHEAQLTLVNVSMRDVPVGIDIDRGYGDWLWGKDVRFENVSQAGVIISNETNVYTQIGFENALARNTPVFAKFRDSGKTVNGKGSAYKVSDFTHGLTVPALGQLGHFETHVDMAPASVPKPKSPAIRPLPPVAQWSNARDSGATGDGKTDDTAAIQTAIDSHRVVYLPLGVYKVTDTIQLKKDSVLIGLQPSLTQIALADNTPAYAGIGEPKALVKSADGGDAIISGVGLFTGGINLRATALLWSAGENSLVDDVKFEGGHGTTLANGARFNPYNDNHSGDADAARRWDGQYPSLWVTNGGGGTFNGILSPDTYASAGLYVSDTDTPGHVYEISVEHHVRNELVLNRVSNWELLAPQTEEEYGESRYAVSLETRDSHDILVANYHGYRATRTLGPAPSAARVYRSHDIHFRNVHVNAENEFATNDSKDCATFLRLSKFSYDNAIQDMSYCLDVRAHEFARLDVPPNPGPQQQGTEAKEILSGFEALGGGAFDSHGTLYFVDRNMNRIYAWTQAQGLTILASHPLDPVNLAVDKSDNLLVLSSAGFQGSVYSLKPGAPDGVLTRIAPGPAGAHANAAVVLPVDWWVNGEFKDQYDPASDHFTTIGELFAADVGTAPAQQYASPDGSIVLPAD